MWPSSINELTEKIVCHHKKGHQIAEDLSIEIPSNNLRLEQSNRNEVSIVGNREKASSDRTKPLDPLSQFDQFH